MPLYAVAVFVLLAFFAGWPIILFVIAERLRNLGKFTFADVASFRLARGPVRTMAAVSTLVVVSFYLIAQMVGAGQLIKLLFGLNYNIAVVVVGVLSMLVSLMASPPTVSAASSAAMPNSNGGLRYQGADTTSVPAPGSIRTVGRESGGGAP